MISLNISLFVQSFVITIQYTINCTFAFQAKLTLDATLQKKLLDPSSQGTMIDDFFIAISVCNTVVVTHRSHTGTEQNGNEDNMEIFYEAQSSDEYALVEVRGPDHV